MSNQNNALFRADQDYPPPIAKTA